MGLLGGEGWGKEGPAMVLVRLVVVMEELWLESETKSCLSKLLPWRTLDSECRGLRNSMACIIQPYVGPSGPK